LDKVRSVAQIPIEQSRLLLRRLTVSAKGAGNGLQASLMSFRLRRKGKRHPGVPAGRPVLRAELPVGLQIEIAFHRSGGKKDPDLRADSCDPSEICAQNRRPASVGGELLEEVTDRADLQILVQELRRAP
jgi:hypothetical protein